MKIKFVEFYQIYLYFDFQAGTGDEFLDELLSNDASLDEGAVPDIKVMDSSINMSGNEVNFITRILTFWKSFARNKGLIHVFYPVRPPTGFSTRFSTE